MTLALRQHSDEHHKDTCVREHLSGGLRARGVPVLV